MTTQPNLKLCQSIREEKFDVYELCEHFEKTAQKINKLSKIIEKNETQNNQPSCKEERRAQYNDEEYNKLIDRIEKIKQKRQKDIENDKKWSEMDDENDELIGRLNRLKPFKIVEDPDLEFYEILAKEEEEELEKINILRKEKDKTS